MVRMPYVEGRHALWRLGRTSVACALRGWRVEVGVASFRVDVKVNSKLDDWLEELSPKLKCDL
jgi:hypothetical protein